VNPIERAIARSATAVNEADRLAGLATSYPKEDTMKFNPGDMVVVIDPEMFNHGRTGRVLGHAAGFPSVVNVTFDDGKPYKQYGVAQLELADA
jgi:hypothetical protein